MAFEGLDCQIISPIVENLFPASQSKSSLLYHRWIRIYLLLRLHFPLAKSFTSLPAIWKETGVIEEIL